MVLIGNPEFFSLYLRFKLNYSDLLTLLPGMTYNKTWVMILKGYDP